MNLSNFFRLFSDKVLVNKWNWRAFGNMYVLRWKSQSFLFNGGISASAVHATAKCCRARTMARLAAPRPSVTSTWEQRTRRKRISADASWAVYRVIQTNIVKSPEFLYYTTLTHLFNWIVLKMPQTNLYQLWNEYSLNVRCVPCAHWAGLSRSSFRSGFG